MREIFRVRGVTAVMHKNLSRDIKCYIDKSDQELLEILVGALDELKEFDAIMIENSHANVAMAKDYISLVNKCSALEEEIKMLNTALEKSIHDNQIKTSDIFGRSTEKLSDIVDSPIATEIIDEDTIEAPLAEVIPIETASWKYQNNDFTRNRGKKTPGKRKKDLANLPSVNVYELDVNELNRLYGENNWRIAYWHSHRSVECIPTTVYEKISYVPVISVGLEHVLYSVPRENVLISNSIASASLTAIILYHKFFLALPIYRQEIYFKNLGLTLSRQTMNNWTNRLGMEIFSLIYDRMIQLLMEVEYQQCDETYFQVNKDGRSAGTKSFMWVHITSELLKENPIIVYCFEPTRGTEHLRKFYKDFKGYITCDAYISYHVLGKENADIIIICGCMMHLRRRFVKSLSLIDTKGLDYDTVEALPETKVLKLIGKIYDEDEPLKALSAEKRKENREEKVRPLINELYEYLDSLDVTDPMISDRMRDAIQYARNQNKYICRFLDDGNIPIDDGATERAIRPFTIGRNNWIACDSVVGAETTAIMYTIVETAKANKVNVYYYLRYLLEQVPKHLEDKTLDFLDDMLPWSDKYLSYEKTQSMAIPKLVFKENEYDTRPKTPRKSDGGNPPRLLLIQDTVTA
jgi:transposase